MERLGQEPPILKKLRIMIFIVFAMLICVVTYENFERREANEYQNIINGNTYIYENKVDGGNFIIELRKGGKYRYFEGPVTNDIETGKWEVSDDILTLKTNPYDKEQKTQYFKIDKDNNKLIFVKENSNNFTRVTVKDGEMFYLDTK